jgi:SAM-dependent methyltransferase
MTDPPLDPGFDLVICAFNSLQMLPSAEHVLRTFCSVRSLLSPNGRFVFDLYNASYIDPVEAAAPVEEQARTVRSFVDRTGRPIEVHEKATHHPDFVELRWEVTDTSRESGRVLATLDMVLRHYGTEDIEALLARARLEIVERYGDVRRSAFSPTKSKKQVVVCTVGA